VVAQQLFGLMGGKLVAVGVMFFSLGGPNGYIMTLSRIVYPLGRLGIFDR
jgi:amino acid transporter